MLRFQQDNRRNLVRGAACRLTQDVTSLEIQPTIEDVFHADTTSVEEYLKQVEESTILAAIQVGAGSAGRMGAHRAAGHTRLTAGHCRGLEDQARSWLTLSACSMAIVMMQEAQQDVVSSFEAYMEDCMARDWAANKRQLFGLIAPHSGGGIASSSLGQGGQGMLPLIGTPARGGPGEAWAGCARIAQRTVCCNTCMQLLMAGRRLCACMLHAAGWANGLGLGDMSLG